MGVLIFLFGVMLFGVLVAGIVFVIFLVIQLFVIGVKTLVAKRQKRRNH